MTTNQAQAATSFRCVCKRDIAINADRKVVIHLAKPGKAALGACPASLLEVALVTRGAVR